MLFVEPFQSFPRIVVLWCIVIVIVVDVVVDCIGNTDRAEDVTDRIDVVTRVCLTKNVVRRYLMMEKLWNPLFTVMGVRIAFYSNADSISKISVSVGVNVVDVSVQNTRRATNVIDSVDVVLIVPL